MKRCKRVLVVDDERPNRELLEALLTGFGHEVDMAASGSEALAKLDRTHDLVMLDVMMPGSDGFEVTRRIRKESAVSDIPICMVTALTGQEQRLLAVEAGANDFIAKPVDKTELRIRTASLLKIKESQDAIKGYRANLEARNRLLKKNVEQLRVLAALKDEFMRIASHDLKNPLTGILGFATVIERLAANGAPLAEKLQKLIPLIINDARTMQRIILDFLDFQAMEDGQFKLNLEAVDLNAIAGLSIAQNAESAERKGIALARELADGLPAVHADASRIRQVVDNFVGNAIKFSGKNGRVSVQTRQSDGDVLLEVTDRGPGLNAEDLKKLFVKYAKLSNRATGGEKSSGLGLAICRRLIELNAGEIGGRNNEGEGATFWFKLPILVALA